MSCGEALVRYLSFHYSPIQIAFLDFAVVVGLVGATMFGLKRGELFRTKRLNLLVIRGLLSAAATVAFFFAIKNLNLDDAVTVGLAGPIFVALLSGWLLGEKVSFMRWAAIVVGFVGVVVVMRPGAGLFNVWSFVALASAALYAVGMMVNRKLTQTEDSLTILFYLSLFAGLALLPFMFFVWQSTPYWELPILFAIGVLEAVSAYLLIQAYRFAVANMVITFDYVGVIYIAIVSYIVFTDVPSWNLVAGAAFLIGSGMYIAFDEARTHRLRSANPDV